MWEVLQLRAVVQSQRSRFFPGCHNKQRQPWQVRTLTYYYVPLLPAWFTRPSLWQWPWKGWPCRDFYKLSLNGLFVFFNLVLFLEPKERTKTDVAMTPLPHPHEYTVTTCARKSLGVYHVLCGPIQASCISCGLRTETEESPAMLQGNNSLRTSRTVL